MNDEQAPVVLIVEDDRSVRELLETVLEQEGYRVLTARDGLEGLVKLRTDPPAVMILDIMMPDVGGIRVLDEIDAEHGDVAILVVTGKPAAAAEARERLGAANVFDKPFEIDQVAERVHAVVAGRGGSEA